MWRRVRFFLQQTVRTIYTAIYALAFEEHVSRDIVRKHSRYSHSISAPLSFHNNRKTLVLDLDETLIHSSVRATSAPDFIIRVSLNAASCTFYVQKRPYVDLFLAQVARWYDVVIWTASLASYANPLIDQLDVGRVTKERYFRESCICTGGNFIKDLEHLGMDLKKTMLVDNSPISYKRSPENAVPISSWFDAPDDDELLRLLPVLEALRFAHDVRSILGLRLIR